MKLKAKRIILFVKNVPAVAEFYSDVLGLKVTSDPADKKWIDVDASGYSIGIHSGGAPNKNKRATKTVFYCNDVEAAREELIYKGAKMGMESTISKRARNSEYHRTWSNR